MKYIYIYMLYMEIVDCGLWIVVSRECTRGKQSTDREVEQPNVAIKAEWSRRMEGEEERSRAEEWSRTDEVEEWSRGRMGRRRRIGSRRVEQKNGAEWRMEQKNGAEWRVEQKNGAKEWSRRVEQKSGAEWRWSRMEQKNGEKEWSRRVE
jgi:hypothetical protein